MFCIQIICILNMSMKIFNTNKAKQIIILGYRQHLAEKALWCDFC